MNFQAVKNANGGHVIMLATVMNVVAKQGNFGAQSDCTVVDDAGVQGLITVSNPKPPRPAALPTVAQIGQRLSFYVKAKIYSPTKTYYNGYWNNTAQVAQVATQGVAAQTSKANPTTDGDASRIRSMCVSYAKDLAVAGKIEVDMINCTAEDFRVYIETGQVATQEDPLDDQPFPPQD